jgi:hypothetical protein
VAQSNKNRWLQHTILTNRSFWQKYQSSELNYTLGKMYLTDICRI